MSGSAEKLIEACKEGKQDAVRSLLESKVSVNAKDSLGQTGVMWAARSGHGDVAQVLIEGKADLNAKSDTGETALDIAEEEDDDNMVELLKKSGASASGTAGAADEGDDDDGWGDGGGDDDAWGDDGGGGGADGGADDDGGDWDDGGGGDDGWGGDDDVSNEHEYLAKIQVFYKAEELKESDPAQALELYDACVKAYREWEAKKEAGETDEDVGDDTVSDVLKALDAQVVILLGMDSGRALEKYEEVFAFATNISESELEAAVKRVLNGAVERSDSKDFKGVRLVFERTLKELDRLDYGTLWFDASFLLSDAYERRDQLKDSETVLETCLEKCRDGGRDDPRKGNTLAQIYARLAKMRIEAEKDDDDFLNYIYSKTKPLKVDVPDARNEAVLKECWGKRFGFRGQWTRAFAELYDAFKNYQNTGQNEAAKRCLRYSIMAHMLRADRTQNPLEQKEALAYKNDLSINRMDKLRNAHRNCDPKRFADEMKNLRPDRFMKRYVDIIYNDFRERAIQDMIKSYQRIRIASLASDLCINEDGVIDILVQLILDGRVNGRINEPEGLLDLRKPKDSSEQKKYNGLRDWTKIIDDRRRTIQSEKFNSDFLP